MVVGVGKLGCGDKRLVPGSHASPRSLILSSAVTIAECSITVRFVAERGMDPLPMDVSHFARKGSSTAFPRPGAAREPVHRHQGSTAGVRNGAGGRDAGNLTKETAA